jgi:uncharacterized tellurite resistance protein B-like protein
METTPITSELKSHFLNLYQMAMTDGDFSPHEWKLLYQLAKERNIPSEDLDQILLNPSGKIEIPKDIQTRIEYLYDLVRMILADDIIEEDERITLKKYCRKFEFLEENIDAIAEYLIESVRTGKSKIEIFNELN